MNHQKEGQSAQAAETHARILDAALTAFCAKGFHATTTREIATAAGMSPAGVYVYFDSKQALLTEIVEASHVALVAQLRQVVEDTVPGPDRLRGLVKTFSSFNALNSRTALVTERELNSLDAETFARVRERRQFIMQLLIDTVTDGVETGVFQVDAAEIHDLVFGLLAISIDLARWYHLDGPMTPDELGSMHGRWAVRLVKARDEQGDA